MIIGRTMPPGYVAPLPERLDGTGVVMLTHERDGHEVGHAVQDGQAGQGGTGAAATAGASDLHPLGPGTLPGFGQSRQYFCLDRGGRLSRYTPKTGEAPSGAGRPRPRPRTSLPEGSRTMPGAEGSQVSLIGMTIGIG